MTLADLRRVPPASAIAGPAALVAILGGGVYCQAHGALSGTHAPLQVSLWWSLSGLLPLLGTAGLAARLAPIIQGRPLSGLVALALGFTAAVAVGEVVYADSLLQSQAWASALFRALPAGVGLAALTVIGLRLLAPPAPAVVAPQPQIPGDVALVRSAGNYLSIEAGGREVLIRLPLHEALRRLGSRGFVQVHRTALVNLARIAEVRREGRRLTLRLDDGRTVTVGRAYAAAVRSSLAGRRSSHHL